MNITQTLAQGEKKKDRTLKVVDTPGIEPGTARNKWWIVMLSGRDNQLHHVPYDSNFGE
jgi:hypothetical protein